MTHCIHHNPKLLLTLWDLAASKWNKMEIGYCFTNFQKAVHQVLREQGFSTPNEVARGD